MSDPKLQPQPEDTQPPNAPAANDVTRSSRDMGEATSAGNTPGLGNDETFLKAGVRLGPYELMEKLGEGGMGAVYKASHTRLNKLVALKVLPAHLTRDPLALGRFDREMKAVGALEHPNIVRAMDADEHQGTHYLVMEYVEGRDLQQVVKSDGPFSVPRAAELIRQAATALAYAHKHGLVHRDIKPSNMLVTSEGQLKILDLGLARLSQEENDGLTSTGASMGTPDYMAPEQWADTHSADGRSDLYALGCTLFYLLTARPPFSAEKHKSIVNKMTAHVHEPPPSLVANCPAAPKELDQLYQRLLAKNANQRVATADELVRLLEPFCDHLPDSKPSISRSQPISDAPATLTLGSTKKASSPRKSWSSGFSRSPRVLLWAGSIALVVLIAASIISVFYLNRPSKPTPLPVSGKGWHGWPADAPPPAIAPFTAEEARAHQKRWADYLKVPVEWENTIGMKFVLIPPGEFMMGSGAAEIDEALQAVENDGAQDYWREYIPSEAPRHRVVLTKPVFFAICETTWRNYEAVMENRPTNRTDPQQVDTDDHPARHISWNEAMAFCAQLGAREKFDPTNPGHRDAREPSFAYFLPTEAQWEYAARGGTTTRYWAGNLPADLKSVDWHSGNSTGQYHAVGKLLPNPFGLYDVHGNVWEWCADQGAADYYKNFAADPAIDPLGPAVATGRRILRGGDARHPAIRSRAAIRFSNPADTKMDLLGFRIAISVDAVRTLQSQRSTEGASAGRSWQGWPADAPKPAVAPFTAEEAKQYQKAWAEYLKVPVEWENSIGMKFVLIPPGEFMRGSTEREIEELIADLPPHLRNWPPYIRSQAPVHRVVLTQPFYECIYEVTQRHFERVMKRNPSRYVLDGDQAQRLKGQTSTADFPVEKVSWNDAAEFCARLSLDDALQPTYRREGDTVQLLKGSGYQLPTEAQWEFACRAGTTTNFWTPDADLTRAAWVHSNSGQLPHPVGQLEANPFGLFDVHGNIWEWVQDGWAEDDYSTFARQAAIDPTGTVSTTERVLRGGQYIDGDSWARSSLRVATSPTERFDTMGFRVVLSVEGVRQKESLNQNPR